MKKHLINFAIILFVFVITRVITVFTFALAQGSMLENLGLNKGTGLLITFVLVFIITILGINVFKKRVGLFVVLITIGMVLLTLIIQKFTGASIKYTYKVMPYYITWVLGFLAAYLYFSRESKKILPAIIMMIFPILMSIGAYDLWIHKIEYGNWTGEITGQTIAPFELMDKKGETVNNESLKSKIVLFDFWFIGCRPCWVKFPELQRLYEKYQANPIVEIYAVNRPMARDKPGALFSRIEDKGYSFPVLAGTQEVMDALDVYKYPTVIIINQNGEKVFMGELKAAEKKLESMVSLLESTTKDKVKND